MTAQGVDQLRALAHQQIAICYPLVFFDAIRQFETAAARMVQSKTQFAVLFKERFVRA